MHGLMLWLHDWVSYSQSRFIINVSLATGSHCQMPDPDFALDVPDSTTLENKCLFVKNYPTCGILL